MSRLSLNTQRGSKSSTSDNILVKILRFTRSISSYYVILLGFMSVSMYLHISSKIHTNTKPSFFDRIDGNLVRRLSKPFSSKPISSWCIPEKDLNTSSPSGILYVKVPKTGSSVISSVLERISRNNGLDGNGNGNCALMYRHEDRFQFMKRAKDKSFLIGSVREPASRAISRAFFMKQNKTVDDTMILESLKSTDEQYGVMTRGKGGFELDYMNMNQIANYSAWTLNRKELDLKAIETNVQFVMNNYQFIFLNERIEESLVALQLLLDLRTSDILYLSTKVSGSYFSWPNTEKCERLQKRIQFRAVSKFISSNEWFLHNYGDYLLYAVANKSLDLTIGAIGQERFMDALNEFLSLKRHADNMCVPMTVFPCSSEGKYQEESISNCYWNDKLCNLAQFNRNSE